MNKILLLSLMAFLSTTVFGQKNIKGQYLRTDNSMCYLILNADHTFKYKFLRDLNWDFACGQYEVKGDSVYFYYQSDMFDRMCNSEGVNYTDTSGIILQDAIDRRDRPISARILKNKIITIKVGDVNDPKTIGAGVYYYRRKRSN
jgi:hypothetical protein